MAPRILKHLLGCRSIHVGIVLIVQITKPNGEELCVLKLSFLISQPIPFLYIFVSVR